MFEIDKPILFVILLKNSHLLERLKILWKLPVEKSDFWTIYSPLLDTVHSESLLCLSFLSQERKINNSQSISILWFILKNNEVRGINYLRDSPAYSVTFSGLSCTSPQGDLGKLGSKLYKLMPKFWSQLPISDVICQGASLGSPTFHLN